MCVLALLLITHAFTYRSQEEVNKAYYWLAKLLHPDKAASSINVSYSLPGQAGPAPYSGPLAVKGQLERQAQQETKRLFQYAKEVGLSPDLFQAYISLLYSPRFLDR
jgi:hypothetical protein